MNYMKAILAIETSVPEASVVLWQDGDISFSEKFTTDRSHNSMIFEPLSRALDQLQGEKLSMALVGTGPGSYSGTRVGISAAQGVAIAHGCPAIGIGSLAATQMARSSGTSLAIGDARRGLYFVSEITKTGEAADAELMAGAVFTDRLTQNKEVNLFTFDDPVQLGLSDELTRRVSQCRPEARWILDLWLGLPVTRQNELRLRPLAPAYLRAPFTSKAKGGHPLLR